MIKKTWLVLLGAFMVISAIASLVQTPAGQLSAGIPPANKPASQITPSVPDHIVYGFLFRNVTRNNERNRQLQANGSYFPLKREMGFTDEQARALSEIAAACEFEVKQQDQKAQLIIGEFRAKLPDSKVAPPPPPVLITMWDERNAMILRARDRLQSVLGGEAFNRLDNFARFRYGTNKAPVSITPIRSTSK